MRAESTVDSGWALIFLWLWHITTVCCFVESPPPGLGWCFSFIGEIVHLLEWLTWVIRVLTFISVWLQRANLRGWLLWWMGRGEALSILPWVIVDEIWNICESGRTKNWTRYEDLICHVDFFWCISFFGLHIFLPLHDLLIKSKNQEMCNEAVT